MIRKLAIILILLIGLAVSLKGQNILNSPEILKKNKIASFETENCLGEDYCHYESYFFNEEGQVVKTYFGIVAIHLKYEYDSANRLSKVYTMNNYSKPDSINGRADYFYSKSGDFVYAVNYSYENEASFPEDTTYTFYSPNTYSPENPKHNTKGQIIEHDYGTLRYPCGINYEGDHKLKYQYLENGLIKKVEIYDSNNELILTLKYNYKMSCPEIAIQFSGQKQINER